MINKNIASLIWSPRIERKEVQTWSYVLAIYTGMRKGEILGLRWQDIDLEEKRLSVNQNLVKANGKLTFSDTKTFSSKRRISLPDFVVDSLKKRKAQLNHIKLKLGAGFQDFDLIVCNNTGTPLHPGDINRDFNYVVEKYDLPKYPCYMLRRYFSLVKIQK
jgi:integrase